MTSEVKSPNVDENAHTDQDVENGRTGAPSGELSRVLKSRHMQMIAMCGAVGSGLFVGSGSALYTGGPASLLLGFGLVGVLLLFTMQALGEMAVIFPVEGGYFQYMVRFLDPAWGFALGWDYAIGYLITLPTEITAVGITLQYWQGAANVNIGVWIAVFYTVLAVIQVFGVRGYAEVEFVLASIKICAIVGFVILGIIIDCGGVPTQHTGYIGAAYWHDPGAFRNGFKGFCSVFVAAAFSYAGTELVGLAAAECADPAKAIPKACKQVFWRIVIIYLLSLFILGLIVPSDSTYLLAAHGNATKYSPFVGAIKSAGIRVLPSIFNAVITLAVLSVANSVTYGSSRLLHALAKQGMAPHFLSYVDSKGRPVYCILLGLVIGLLAFINEAAKGPVIFAWMLSLAGLSNFFTWGSICAAHLRYRRAWRLQGRTVDELPYRATIIGSWIGLILSILCIVATFYVALFPLGGKPNAEAFFQWFLAAPFILALCIGWMLYTRRWTIGVRSKDMDIWSGLREDVLLTAESQGARRRNKLLGTVLHGLV